MKIEQKISNLLKYANKLQYKSREYNYSVSETFEMLALASNKQQYTQWALRLTI